MTSPYDIPDPSDWSLTQLRDLAPVETALRCQVCKDFYDTPMITSCSHTFCSLCIRRCLTNDGKCPTCRAGDQELRLRRNWTAEELVESFKRARPALLEFDGELKAARAEVTQGRGKRKRVDVGRNVEDDGAPKPQRRKTRSQSKPAPTDKQLARIDAVEDSEEEEHQEEVQPGKSPSTYIKSFAVTKPYHPTDDGLIACPICSARMKEEEVFPHLDVHNDPLPPPPSRTLSNPSLSSRSVLP